MPRRGPRSQNRAEPVGARQAGVHAGRAALADVRRSGGHGASGTPTSAGRDRRRQGRRRHPRRQVPDHERAHVLNHQGYQTHLGFSGLNDRSALALSSDGQASTPRPGKVFGLVVGIVTEVGTPGQGQPEAVNESVVKVKFPWLDDSYVTSWCRTMQFGGGNGRGALFLPEVNDEVLVGFENGDVRSPFVLGGLYNGVDKPNTDLGGSSLLKNGKVIRRGYRSPNKHGLTFDDDAGRRTASLSSPATTTSRSSSTRRARRSRSTRRAARSRFTAARRSRSRATRTSSSTPNRTST